MYRLCIVDFILADGWLVGCSEVRAEARTFSHLFAVFARKQRENRHKMTSFPKSDRLNLSKNGCSLTLCGSDPIAVGCEIRRAMSVPAMFPRANKFAAHLSQQITANGFSSPFLFVMPKGSSLTNATVSMKGFQRLQI